MNKIFITVLNKKLGRPVVASEDARGGGGKGAIVSAGVIPGKGMAAAAVSPMSGESALAVGASKFSEDGRWVARLSGSVNPRGNACVSAGIGVHW